MSTGCSSRKLPKLQAACCVGSRNNDGHMFETVPLVQKAISKPAGANALHHSLGAFCSSGLIGTKPTEATDMTKAFDTHRLSKQLPQLH